MLTKNEKRLAELVAIAKKPESIECVPEHLRGEAELIRRHIKNNVKPPAFGLFGDEIIWPFLEEHAAELPEDYAAMLKEIASCFVKRRARLRKLARKNKGWVTSRAEEVVNSGNEFLMLARAFRKHGHVDNQAISDLSRLIGKTKKRIWGKAYWEKQTARMKDKAEDLYEEFEALISDDLLLELPFELRGSAVSFGLAFTKYSKRLCDY